MATLAEVLRQTGYSQDGELSTPAPTGPSMTSILQQHIASLPQTTQQNLAKQRQDIDAALQMTPQGIQVGNQQAFNNVMSEVPNIAALTAWHGTPHKIEGAFDINKIGSGEGNQVYGHGMYFAENPKVAESYRTLEPAAGSTPYTRRTFQGVELTPQTPEYHAAHMADKLGVKKAKSEFESWLKNPPDYADESLKSNWQKSLETLNAAKKKTDFGTLPFEGNLYKVDIPDEHIPNMLHWDKPLSEQPKAVQKALAKIDPDMYSKKGSDYDPTEQGQIIYHRLSQIDMNKNGPFTGAAKNVSNLLNSHGIKGIRYLDQGSRAVTGGELVGITKTPQGYVSKVKVENRGGAGFSTPTQQFTSSTPFKTEAEAKAWADEKIGDGTSNFVVFDPSTVKILEENGKPLTRKELIEKQVKDLKD